MDLLWTLSLLGTILLTPLLLLVTWAVYCHINQAEIPPGISQRFQMRLLHCMMLIAFRLRKIHIINGYALFRLFMDGIPPLKDPQLFIKNLTFDGIPVRMYQPKGSCDGGWRGILFFHGGTGMYGSIDAYERVCRGIAKESNSLVVSVGYRLVPEHPYPAQFQDCLTAATYFMKNAKDYGVNPALIIVSGESSGGTIAASVCQNLVNRSDLPKIRAQILIYPYLQAVDFNLPSHQRNGRIPPISQEQVVEFGLEYLQKDMSVVKDVLEGWHIPRELRLKYSKWLGPENLPKEFKWEGYRPPQPPSESTRTYEGYEIIFETTLSPLLAEDAVIQRLPEAYILTCQYDIFMDDGLLYKKRLEDNGVGVTWYSLEGGFHGVLYFFRHWFFSFPDSQNALNCIVNFIKSL